MPKATKANILPRFFESFLTKLDKEFADFYAIEAAANAFCARYKKAMTFHRKHVPKLHDDRQRRWDQIEKIAQTYENQEWDDSVAELSRLMKESFAILQTLTKKNNRTVSIRTALLMGTEGKKGKLDLRNTGSESDCASDATGDQALREIFELFDHLFFDLSQCLISQQKKIDSLYTNLVSDVVLHGRLKRMAKRPSRKK